MRRVPPRSDGRRVRLRHPSRIHDVRQLHTCQLGQDLPTEVLRVEGNIRISLFPLVERPLPGGDGGATVAPDLAWEDLDRAIDAVTSIFEQYSLRLTGVAYEVRYEKVDRRNWQKVFTQPIFEAGSVDLNAGLG